MITEQTVKDKLQNLIDESNSVTKRNDTDITEAVQSLIEGCYVEKYTPQEKTVKPSKEAQTIVADEGYVLSGVKVEAIPNEYIIPYDDLKIESNGTHDVTNYASVTVNVNVPIPDGYIKPSGTLDITSNGTHNVADKENVNVNVPIPDGYIQPSGTLPINTLGEKNVAKYEKVNVSLPDGYMQIPTETLSITANGSNIDVTNKAKVNVNVPTYITVSSVENLPNDSAIGTIAIVG